MLTKRTNNLSFDMRSLLLLLGPLVLILSSDSIATAQIGGPIRTKTDAASPHAKSSASVSQRFEREGIAVEFSVKTVPDERSKSKGLVSGANAVATFRLSDARTGQPLTGLHPNAWISSRRAGQESTAAACKDKIGSFMGGLLSARPDVDLNSYLILTINHDNTISIINPQVAFSRTKLESLIVLPGAGADWVLSQGKDLLYVTLPEQSAVVAVDTVSRKIVGTIKLKEGTKPRRLSLDPSGNQLWVGLDDSSDISVINTKTKTVAATINVGEGLHEIEFVPNRFAYVTNSKANTVSVIDTAKLTKRADLKVSDAPVPIAYSPASRLVYVASVNGDTISIIDPVKQRLIDTIPTERGVVALRFAPGGRFGFLVNQVNSQVSILDAATNKIVGRANVVKEPNQVVFTRRYAYVHSIGSEKFSLIELTDFNKTSPAPVDIQGGQKPPSTMPEEIGVAEMIAPTPEGNAVMIANNPDQMIYYYVEGMMAPMGTFSNYKRRPRALLLLDRSLSEVAPGTYSAHFKLRQSGSFDVPVLIDQPRMHNCFQLEVGPSPDSTDERGGASIAVEATFNGEQFKAGEASPLRFKVKDAVTRHPIKGLTDLTVLVFEPPGTWQQRQMAREVSPGIYEVKQIFPREGVFNVMVGVASRGVGFADLPLNAVRILENAPKAETSK
jgi:YVTN family beta-propeller protein